MASSAEVDGMAIGQIPDPPNFYTVPKDEIMTRPPTKPLRVSKWSKTEYQETYQTPGWLCSSGDENCGPDAETKRMRSVLGLDPKLTKVDYISVCHEFLPAPAKKAPGRPKRPLTMVERIREREYQAAIEAGKQRPLTSMTTENQEVFVPQDMSRVRARSTPNLSPQDQRRKQAQTLGVLALDPKHHNMKGSTSMKTESFQDWGQYLGKRASAEKPKSAMEKIKERDFREVLNAVERGKASSQRGGDKVGLTEYGTHFQGKQRDHSKDHNVVTKGLDDEDVATRGSLGTRVLHDVNAYWVGARERRSVLGLKQHLRPIRQLTTTMEAYQDTSAALRRNANVTKVLTMTEKINQRDHKALMERIERARLEACVSETRMC